MEIRAASLRSLVSHSSSFLVSSLRRCRYLAGESGLFWDNRPGAQRSSLGSFFVFPAAGPTVQVNQGLHLLVRGLCYPPRIHPHPPPASLSSILIPHRGTVPGGFMKTAS
ncbi:unnamed protein product [Prorocentrum cordatum]|uniref:Uncharacterized protein n=1 Tax=Prorocentrum cordatum TaxID=2364126 RepID=A0ABN9YBZ1_9DINO|nr:unnamed protein product [Polarella glacialis]